MHYILDEEGYLLGNTDSNNDNLPVILGLKTERIDLEIIYLPIWK